MSRLLPICAFTFLLTFSLHSQPPTPEKMALAREHFNAGVKSGIDQDFETAVKEFAKATELNPLSAEYFLYKGLAEIELQRYDQAIKDFTIAIELDPSFSDQAHYFRGLTRYFKEEYRSAIDDLTVAIRMNPDFISFYQRGKANLMLKEYRRSLQDFDIAIRLKEDFYEAYLFRGISYYYLGNYDEAVKDFEIARRNLDDKEQVDQYLALISQAWRNDTTHSQTITAESHRRLVDRSVPVQAPERPSATDLNFNDLFTTSRSNTAEQDSTTVAISGIGEQSVPPTTQNPAVPRREDSVVPAQSVSQTPHQTGLTVNNNQPANIDNLQTGIYSQHLHKMTLRGFGVQVASYSTTNNLISLAEAYSGKYERPVFINVSVVNGRKLYKVIIGQFQNRVEAETFRNKLRGESFPDCFLVVYENF